MPCLQKCMNWFLYFFEISEQVISCTWLKKPFALEHSVCAQGTLLNQGFPPLIPHSIDTAWLNGGATFLRPSHPITISPHISPHYLLFTSFSAWGRQASENNIAAVFPIPPLVLVSPKLDSLYGRVDFTILS